MEHKRVMLGYGLIVVSLLFATPANARSVRSILTPVEWECSAVTSSGGDLLLVSLTGMTMSSSDAGRSWRRKHIGFELVACHVGADGVGYALAKRALWRTAKPGHDWKIAVSLEEDASGLSVDEQAGTATVYLASSAKLYVSSNKTEFRKESLAGTVISTGRNEKKTVQIKPDNNNLIVSRDGGRTWFTAGQRESKDQVQIGKNGKVYVLREWRESFDYTSYTLYVQSGSDELRPVRSRILASNWTSGCCASIEPFRNGVVVRGQSALFVDIADPAVLPLAAKAPQPVLRAEFSEESESERIVLSAPTGDKVLFEIGPDRFQLRRVARDASSVWVATKNGVLAVRDQEGGPVFAYHDLASGVLQLEFPHSSNSCFVLTKKALWKLDVNVEQWKQISPVAGREFESLAVSHSGTRIWVTSHEPASGTGHSQVHLSEDGGTSWRGIPSPDSHLGGLATSTDGEEVWLYGRKSKGQAIYRLATDKSRFLQEDQLPSGRVSDWMLTKSGSIFLLQDGRLLSRQSGSKQWNSYVLPSPAVGDWGELKMLDDGRGWLSRNASLFTTDDYGQHWFQIMEDPRDPHELSNRYELKKLNDILSAFWFRLDLITVGQRMRWFDEAVPPTPIKIDNVEVVDYEKIRLTIADSVTATKVLDLHVDVEGGSSVYWQSRYNRPRFGSRTSDGGMIQLPKLERVTDIPVWPKGVFVPGETYSVRVQISDGLSVFSRAIAVTVPRLTGASQIELSSNDAIRLPPEWDEVEVKDIQVTIGKTTYQGGSVVSRGPDGSTALLPGNPSIANQQDGFISRVLIESKNTSKKLMAEAMLVREKAQYRLNTPFEKSYALMIAVSVYPKESGYQNKPIPKAEEQAKRLGGVLQSLGFILLPGLFGEKATKANIEAAITGANLGPKDRLVVYFGGHGATDTSGTGAEIGYIVPHDAKAGELLRTAIPMSQFRTTFSGVKAKHVLFLLDACASGLATAREGASTTTDKLQALRLIEAATRQPTRQILVASTGKQRAWDSDKGGLFTEALIAGLGGSADRGGNGVITLQELEDFVFERVVGDAKGLPEAQYPRSETFTGEGRFVFVLKDPMK